MTELWSWVCGPVFCPPCTAASLLLWALAGTDRLAGQTPYRFIDPALCTHCAVPVTLYILHSCIFFVIVLLYFLFWHICFRMLCHLMVVVYLAVCCRFVSVSIMLSCDFTCVYTWALLLTAGWMEWNQYGVGSDCSAVAFACHQNELDVWAVIFFCIHV